MSPSFLRRHYTSILGYLGNKNCIPRLIQKWKWFICGTCKLYYQLSIRHVYGFDSTRYAFRMVLHVRWHFLTTSLLIPTESFAMIQNTFSRIFYTLRYVIMLNTLRKVGYLENYVRWIYLTTDLNMGESRKYARSENVCSRICTQRRVQITAYINSFH